MDDLSEKELDRATITKEDTTITKESRENGNHLLPEILAEVCRKVFGSDRISLVLQEDNDLKYRSTLCSA